MKSNTTRFLKTILSAIHFSGAHNVMGPLLGGRGVIFMLHRVSPDPVLEFEPNRILRVTPDFLREVIEETRAAGFDFCSMDEAHDRLKAGGDAARPFACLTLDDGYRDNLEHAWPVLKQMNVPAAIYVPGEYPSGGADLWWITLEHVIREMDEVRARVGGQEVVCDTTSLAGKEHCHDQIYWMLRHAPELEARSVVADLAERAGIDRRAIARDLLMTWDEVRRMAEDPLITIGAHTAGHYALAKLSDVESERQLVDGVRMIEAALDFKCRHLAYPYGDSSSVGRREFEIAERLGFKTAVTTSKGVIQSRHSDQMMALPRLSLNGDFQDMRYVDVLRSGVPFALLNSLRSCRQMSRRLTQIWA